jgi:sirohydrochlorin cobaltochelatase
MRGLLLFAHGARDPEWARPFESIRDRIRAQRPELPVELAYLEVMKPSLEEGIDRLTAQGASSITVFPLFMAQGGHLKQDVPRILADVRAGRPHVPLALETAIGDVPELLDAIAAWVMSKC